MEGGRCHERFSLRFYLGCCYLPSTVSLESVHLYRVTVLPDKWGKSQGQRSVDLRHRLGYCHGNRHERLCMFDLGNCVVQVEELRKGFAGRCQRTDHVDFAEGGSYPGGAVESRRWNPVESNMIEVDFPIRLALDYRRTRNEESYDGKRLESTVAMKHKAVGCPLAVASFGDSLRAGKAAPCCYCVAG